MKILVTGVHGQLGHDVMNELAKRGHEGLGTDIFPLDEKDGGTGPTSTGRRIRQTAIKFTR